MRTLKEKHGGIKKKRLANIRPLSLHPQEAGPRRWRLSGSSTTEFLSDRKSIDSTNPFDALSNDVLISVLCKVSAAAMSPSDLINVMLIKRFSTLGVDRQVLSKASGKSMCVRAKNWCDSSHEFLKLCADAGNLEACYFLGMIHFHCLRNYASGTALLERAAKGSHSAALNSLAIIRFNGSADVDGRSSCQQDLNCAASLCVKSAKLGNVDALREVGFCLQNGVGLPPSPTAAYHLLHKANYKLKINAGTTSPNSLFSPKGLNPLNSPRGLNPLISPRRRSNKDISLLTNYGYMGREVHAANMFMVEWWWLGDKGEDGLHMCSNVVCGRREHERMGLGGAHAAARRCTAHMCARRCIGTWSMALVVYQGSKIYNKNC